MQVVTIINREDLGVLNIGLLNKGRNLELALSQTLIRLPFVVSIEGEKYLIIGFLFRDGPTSKYL